MTVLTIHRRQEADLPAAVDVVFYNYTSDYQQGLQKAQRLSTQSFQRNAMQLAIVFDDFQARQVAERLLYNAWVERNTFIFRVSRRYAYLEPTDIITLIDADSGSIFSVRITNKSESRNGMIDFQAVANDSPIYQQKTTTGTALPSDQEIYIVGPTNTIMLDIPMLRDADTNVGVYVAMNGLTSTTWPGAVLFKSTDSGVTYVAGATTVNAAPTGRATTALGSWTGGNMFDEARTVNIHLDVGTLSGTTMLDVLNGNNAAALKSGTGWEIIQYKNAVLETDGSYTLSGLLRGRKGTEWAMSGHAVGDIFVALSPSWITRVTMESSEVGLARKWKAVTFHQELSDAVGFDFTNTSESLECYSPVHIGGGRNQNSDVIINWLPRTRIGGAWSDYSDVPLVEVSQSYEVEVWNSTYTTLKRTISSLTSPTATYTTAQQVTDFGSNQATVYVKVFQLSSSNGRGREARGQI